MMLLLSLTFTLVLYTVCSMNETNVTVRDRCESYIKRVPPKNIETRAWTKCEKVQQRLKTCKDKGHELTELEQNDGIAGLNFSTIYIFSLS